jgi:hypothetical protein
MADTLRSKMIRLAASMPKGSSERKALLDVLAGDRTGALSEDEVKKRLYETTVAFEKARKRQKQEKQRGYGGPWAKGHHLGVEVKRLQQEVWQYERMLERMGVPFTPHVPGARPTPQ